MKSSDAHYKLISLHGIQVLFTENNIDSNTLSNNFFVYKMRNDNGKMVFCDNSEYDAFATIISKEPFSILTRHMNMNHDIFTLCENCSIEDYKGYCITYVDLDTGKSRVYKRCKTKDELNACLHKIYSENSGWTEEELQSMQIISNYNYMLPY